MKQIPLKTKSKLPAHNNWRRREYSAEFIAGWKGNIGLRLDPEDLIIDIDTKHDDAKGASSDDLEVALEMEFGIDLSGYPAVQTGSGGRHVYMNKPADLRIREKLKDTFGGAIEFKTVGRQVLAPGCTHPNGKPYVVIRKGQISMGPDALLQALKRPPPPAPSEHAEADGEELTFLLDQLDVTQFRDYDEWRNIMFACHDASEGGTDGRDAFKAWSLKDDEFASAGPDIDCFWEACQGNEDGRTLASLYWLVSEAGGEIPGPDPLEDFAEILAAVTPEEKAAIYQPSWRVNSFGKIRGNLAHNVVEAMNVMKVELAMNDFSHKIIRVEDGREMDDDTLSYVAQDISNTMGPRWSGDPTKEALHNAAKWIARSHRYHPVQDYLEGLKWDGQQRLETWLIEGAGAKPNRYVRAVSKLLLVASVARIYQPGVKYDTMVILEGKQGTGKSSLVKYLGGEWALEGLPPLRGANDKDVVDAMQGYWIIEIEELAATRKAEADVLKAFLSRTADRVRLAYERNSRTFPRQCVFIGTTNEQSYMRDQTGNRRMAPIEVGTIDMTKIPRDQLWAEALVEWRGWKWPLTLPPVIWADAAEEQEERLILDPWESIFREVCFEKLVGQDFVATEELLSQGAHISHVDQNQSHSRRLSVVMQRLGLKKTRRRVGDGPNAVHGYTMPPNRS